MDERPNIGQRVRSLPHHETPGAPLLPHRTYRKFAHRNRTHRNRTHRNRTHRNRTHRTVEERPFRAA